MVCILSCVLGSVGFFIIGLELSAEARVSYVSKQHRDQQPTGHSQTPSSRLEPQLSIVEWDRKFYRWPSGCRSTLLSQSFWCPSCLAQTVLQDRAQAVCVHGPFCEVLVISTTCAWVRPSKCPPLLVHHYSTCRADPWCTFTVQERISVQALHSSRHHWGR